MKALLICPSLREEVAGLAEAVPLSNVPLLGKSLVECWLDHLEMSGTKNVRILANDRPEQVHALVGDGARWGLRAEVISESRELTPDQARAIYDDSETGETPAPLVATLMDHLPGLPQSMLLASYADWFATLQALLPNAKTTDRIGVREVRPGVWLGLHAHVSSTAQLHPPCWIGADVWIGADAVIGPMAVLEDKVFVEPGAEILSSAVAPETFVGKFTQLNHSLVCGSTLVDWKTNSCIHVPDVFVLCSLGRARGFANATNWFDRLAATYAKSKEEFQSLCQSFLAKKGDWEGNEYENPTIRRNIKHQ